ncbi:Cytochrome c oxidase assembly protein cox18, mitochondrial [Sparganum proliferum]
MVWRKLKSLGPATNVLVPSVLPATTDTTAASDRTFPVIKSGPLYWARDKQGIVVQRAHAVLIPQRLLLYNREEDYETDPYNPQVSLDLQTCLAVQKTDGGAKNPDFILLVVPGGARLFGCESLVERDHWVDKINVAMDADIQTRQMQEIINGFSQRTNTNFAFFHSLSLTDSSDYNLLDSRKSFSKRAGSLDSRLIIPSVVPFASSETLIVESIPDTLAEEMQTVTSTQNCSAFPHTEGRNTMNLPVSCEAATECQSELLQPKSDRHTSASPQQHTVEDPHHPYDTLKYYAASGSESSQNRENPVKHSEALVSDHCARKNLDLGLSHAEGKEVGGCSCLRNNQEMDEVAGILQEVHPQLFDEPWNPSKTCLAVQKTDGGAKNPDFILLVVPGGARLFGCESLVERDHWVDKINVAMDADIQTRQMQEIINGFSQRTNTNFAFFHSLSLTDSSDYNLLDSRKSFSKRAGSLDSRLIIPSVVPFASSETLIVESSPDTLAEEMQTVTSTQNRSASPHTEGRNTMNLPVSGEVAIECQSEPLQPKSDRHTSASPQQHTVEDPHHPYNTLKFYAASGSENSQNRENPVKHSEALVSDHCARKNLNLGLSHAEGKEVGGCSCLRNNQEMDEVAGILQEVHSQLFDEPWNPSKKICVARSQSPPPVSESGDKGTIFREIKKLSMMLASQETACNILHESCATLKDTISHLQRQMLNKERPQSASDQDWSVIKAPTRRPRESRKSRMPGETSADLGPQRKDEQDCQATPFCLSSSESDLTTSRSRSAETLHASASTCDSDVTLVHHSNSPYRQEWSDDDAPEDRRLTKGTHAIQTDEKHSSASSHLDDRPDILQEVTLYTCDTEAPVMSCLHCIFPALSVIIELLLSQSPENSSAPRTDAEYSIYVPITARLRSLAMHLFSHVHHLLSGIRTEAGASDTALTAAISDCVLEAIRKERVTGSLPPLTADMADTDSSLQALLRSATTSLCTLIFDRNNDHISETSSSHKSDGDSGGGGGGHDLERVEGAHLAQQDRRQVEMVLPAYLVACSMIYCLCPRTPSTSTDQTDCTSDDSYLQRNEHIYQSLGLNSTLNPKPIIEFIGSLSRELLDQLEEEEASSAFSYELGQARSSNERLGTADTTNIEFTPLFWALLTSLNAVSLQNPSNKPESGRDETVRNLDSELIHGNPSDSWVSTRAKEILPPDGPAHTETISALDDAEKNGVKSDGTLVSNSLTRSLDHLESLSVSLMQQRKFLLQRSQSRESEVTPARSSDQDAEDYARAVVALQRQHEEDIKAIWDNVKANWVPKEEFETFAAETEQQIQTLHQHLKRICAEAQNLDNAQENGRVNLCGVDGVLGDQDQGNPSLFILLRQLEKANEAFTSFLRSETFRQEFERKGADRRSGEMAEGVTKALADLTSAAVYLRARLYGKDFEGIEEDEKELPSSYDCDDQVNGGFRVDFMKRCHSEGCHPLKSAAFGLIQLPLWITLTCGLRNACGLWVSPFIYWPPMIPEFLANGLASPTHSLALVALLTAANLANAELAHLRRLYMLSAVEYATKNPEFLSQSDSPASPPPVVLFPVRQSWQLHFVHGLGIFGSLLVSVVSLMAPSALTIFWCTSSVHQLFINLFHLSPRVRSSLGIPTSYIDPKHPYITLWLVALQNYRILTPLRSRKQ